MDQCHCKALPLAFGVSDIASLEDLEVQRGDLEVQMEYYLVAHQDLQEVHLKEGVRHLVLVVVFDLADLKLPYLQYLELVDF